MKTISALVLSAFMISGAIFAVNPYKPYTPRGKAAEKYYNGEITQEEYLDSLVPQCQTEETTIYHSDGSKSLIRSDRNGHGTIYHPDGSKSIY
jgi:hypothetical protein